VTANPGFINPEDMEITDSGISLLKRIDHHPMNVMSVLSAKKNSNFFIGQFCEYCNKIAFRVHQFAWKMMESENN
jgi:hypothetical protein